MSIKDDLGLIKKYRELEDATSMTVKIRQDQICEIVVADLMAKYKACSKRNDEYKDSFANVLRFYLDEDEFNEMLGILEIPRISQGDCESLLLCPFCGGIPKLPDGNGTQYEIECECGMASSSIQISDFMSYEERATDPFMNYRYGEEYIERAKREAINKWNIRRRT